MRQSFKKLWQKLSKFDKNKHLTDLSSSRNMNKPKHKEYKTLQQGLS